MKRLLAIGFVLLVLSGGCTSSETADSSGVSAPASGGGADATSDTTSLGSSGDLVVAQPGELDRQLAVAATLDGDGIVPVDALPTGAETFEFAIDSHAYRCEKRASRPDQARCRATSQQGAAIMYCSDAQSSATCSPSWYPDEFGGLVPRTIEGQQYLCSNEVVRWACSLYAGGDPADTQLVPSLYCVVDGTTFVCDPVAGLAMVPNQGAGDAQQQVAPSTVDRPEDVGGDIGEVPVQTLSIEGGRYFCESYTDGTLGCYPDDGSGLLVGEPTFICWSDLVCDRNL